MSYNNNYKPSEMADAIREIVRVSQEVDLCPTSRSLTIALRAENAKTLSVSETMVPGALKGRWILIGGVKRQVINNSTSGIVLNEAIESAAIGTKIYPGEDGENLNYVETIAGTLANPWGEANVTDLKVNIPKNNITAYIDFKDGTSNVRIFLRFNTGFFGGDCSSLFGATLLASYYI